MLRGAWLGLILAGIFAVTSGGAVAAGKREVPVSLSKYCKRLKLHFAGFNKKTKKFMCAVQATGFNTWYYTKHRNINLSAVCRKYHKTSLWRFQGKKVWCVIESRGADLTLCNKQTEPVWAAIGYHVKPTRRLRTERGWVTQGWWKIAPGKCSTPWRGKKYKGAVYPHGMTRSSSLPAQDTRLCIQYGKTFKIGSSDTVPCQGQDQKRVGMSKLTVRTGVNRWNFR